MDTYTRHTLSAIFPTNDSLTNIGSVATNWSRSTSSEEAEEHFRFANSSTLAENILATHGIPAYEKYLAEMQACNEADRLADEREREKWLARKRAVKRFAGAVKRWIARRK